jgi:hypothetical protein
MDRTTGKVVIRKLDQSETAQKTILYHGIWI